MTTDKLTMASYQAQKCLDEFRYDRERYRKKKAHPFLRFLGIGGAGAVAGNLAMDAAGYTAFGMVGAGAGVGGSALVLGTGGGALVMFAAYGIYRMLRK